MIAPACATVTRQLVVDQPLQSKLCFAGPQWVARGFVKAREAARQKAIEARKKALADPLPDPATVEQGVYAD